MRGRPLRRAILAGTVLTLGGVAGLVLAINLLNSAEQRIGQGSPSPAALPSPSPVASHRPRSVAPSMAEQSPIAVASAEPTPDMSGPIVRWATAAVFSSDGWAEEVADMTYAAGHFIGLGYREPDDQRGQVGPPTDEPRIWISPDGVAWERVDVGTMFESAHPRTVIALPDGSAVAFGTIDPEPPANPRSAAWRSTDGRTWTPIELRLPRDDWLGQVVSGPLGLISVVSISTEEGETEEVWYSVDGATWTVTHTIEASDGFEPGVYDAQAGPEGFVITGYRYRFNGDEREDQAFVLASADGRGWFEAPSNETTFEIYTHVASIGSDWIIAANGVREDGRFSSLATTWFSANGLAWDERATIQVPMPTSPYADEETSTVISGLVSTGDRVIASGSVVICCHGPRWAAGVWSSFDGRSWERLGFPPGTVVTAAAEHDGIVVLAGFDRAHPEDDFKARAVFWVGERR